MGNNEILRVEIEGGQLEYDYYKMLEYICSEYDLYPQGYIYNLGNDCIGLDLVYNGGSAMTTFTTYDLMKLKENKEIDLILREYEPEFEE